jgi:hypothetical protein
VLQIRVISGALAGTQYVARQFPFRIGRSKAADLSIEGDGVWDEHVQIGVDDSSHSLVLTASPDSPAYVNGQLISTADLRNGDVITMGSVQLQCLLSAVHHKNLAPWEIFFWIFLAAMTLLEIRLFYWLQN